MAIIPQKNLFSWKEIESLGDLERLRLVLEYLPDEPLMYTLEKQRKKGRNDYPIRPVWNSIIAGIIYQHPSIESLRRELQRNAQLRDLCGFDPVREMSATPPASVYTRFLKLLHKNSKEVDSIFENLVDSLDELLPGFGRMLAMDGKAIPTYARRRKERKNEPDGRRDTDADTGVKTYKGKREDGTVWETTKCWFGYKLHLIIDADYELPVGFNVTPASKSEHTEGKRLISSLSKRHPKLVEDCEALMADKGYDSAGLNSILWRDHEIKPVIDIRNMWKDGEETKELNGIRNLVYDYRGNVYCYCMRTLERRRMAYGGFEKERGSLKYRCPARHYGFECKWQDRCAIGATTRINLSADRRVFTPIARSSYKWKKLYNKRTAVERVNSRIDFSFGFERHFIRGLRKMQLRVGLSLIVMLAMAKGHAVENRPDMMRSLVQIA